MPGRRAQSPHVKLRRGRKVVLVDKATFPRQKVCGSCVNRAAVSTLEQLGLGHVLKDALPIKQVVVGYGRRSIVFPLPNPVALSRESLDTPTGAGSRGGWSRVSSWRNSQVGRRSPGYRDVVMGGGSISARAVVLATGLAGGEGTAEAGSRIGGGVIVPQADTPSFYESGTIYMATGRGGYSGVLVVEGGKVDVAAAFDPAFVKSCGGLGPASEALLRGVGWPSPPGWATLPWKGTPALTRQSTKVADERLFLVGDAAGYVEPFTGEGMAWAIMSAAGLAPIASRAPEWRRRPRDRVGAVVSSDCRPTQTCLLVDRQNTAVPHSFEFRGTHGKNISRGFASHYQSHKYASTCTRCESDFVTARRGRAQSGLRRKTSKIGRQRWAIRPDTPRLLRGRSFPRPSPCPAANVEPTIVARREG